MSRLRHAEVVLAILPTGEAPTGSVTVTLDGQTVVLQLPTDGYPAGVLPGDIAWLGQDGRRLAWLGYGYANYATLSRRWSAYQSMYDADIAYDDLRRL